MKPLEILLIVGGILHFCILIAAGLVPGVLDWKRNLGRLPKLLERLVWVYGGFIVLVIVGFGVLTLFHYGEIAEGQPIARSFAAFVCVFWGVRLLCQFFVFDARPYLSKWHLKVGYHLLTFVFLYLTIVFGLAAANPFEQVEDTPHGYGSSDIYYFKYYNWLTVYEMDERERLD